MPVCIICRNRQVAPTEAGVCERCEGVLAADGHQLWPDRPAPEEITEEILTELRERVARLVGGVSFERELSRDEVEALLQGFPR